MKMRTRHIGKYLAGICLMAFCLGMSVSAAENTILKGVMIEQVDVSGMTKNEALSAIASYERKVGEKVLHLSIGSHVVDAKLSDFGITCSDEAVVEEALGLGRTGDVLKRYKDQKDLQHGGKVYSLGWEADEAKVRAFVKENCTKYDQEAKNASLTRENGSFQFIPGSQGLVLDENASVKKIMNYLSESWNTETAEDTLELQTKITEPEGSAEELANVKDLLGSFSTSFSSSNANRSKNVASGAGHIDGTILYPGDEFSTYEVVSPFTEENGYAMAGSYLNGEVVDSMGGGICQVSTTLYNAVLRAELEVLERSPHSMTVHYVELSEDAAIAGTYKDFKFKNSTGYPIYIEGYTTADKRIVFNVYGKETRDSNREISFVSVKTGETPPSVILREDGGQPIGYKVSSKGTTAYTAELYKVVKVNGVETERIKINKSSYKGSNRVVTYGTAGDPVMSENLRAAIALQDEALADANVAAAVPPAPADPAAEPVQ